MADQDERIYCYIHERVEVVTPDSLVCFECKHVYESESDLVAQYNELQAQWRRAGEPMQFIEAVKAATVSGEAVDDVEQVPFCPLCLHNL